MVSELRVDVPVLAAVSEFPVRAGEPVDEILVLTDNGRGQKRERAVKYADAVREPAGLLGKYRDVVVQGNLVELLHAVFGFTAQESRKKPRRVGVAYDAEAFLCGDYFGADVQTKQIYFALAAAPAAHPIAGPAEYLFGGGAGEVLRRFGDPRQFRKPATKQDRKLRMLNARFSLFPGRVEFVGNRPAAASGGQFCLSDSWWPAGGGWVSPAFLAYASKFPAADPSSVVNHGRQCLKFLHDILECSRLKHPELVLNRPPVLLECEWLEFKEQFGGAGHFESVEFGN